MNQIISTAQEALQQEQKTVELLRQQVSKPDKVRNDLIFLAFVLMEFIFTHVDINMIG